MNDQSHPDALAGAARRNGGACSPDLYLTLDATAMGALVQRGELEPQDLLEAALARCDEVNARVNAVNQRCEARARQTLASRRAAGTSRDGAFAGVPTLAKDMHTAVAGTVTTNGSRSLRDAPPATHDATLIARYEAAGVVVFGKTATPEFGLSTTTESALWGKTCNPWNLSMSAGGSSGGAAAAVAAGIVPVAHATDGGGSIRIPASYCGVFGMKPTRYRTPHGPDAFEGWFGASCAHVVSRSVRDSALALDVSHGHEKGSPYWLAVPERPFADEVRRTPSRLRVGLVADSLTGMPLDNDIAAVLESTVRLLTGLGHEVEPVTLAIDSQQLFGAHATASGTAFVAAVRDREAALGRALLAEELEPVAWRILRNAQQHSAETLYRARRTFERFGLLMEEKFDRFDVLLSPVTATLTPTLGRLSLEQEYEDYIKHIVGSVSYTALANVSGQPSMSVPLGTSRDGLPIGMMFTAGLCREGLLFQLAGQLEAAQPWALLAPLA
ncbi:MAG TPA: amidase [Paraburkholderia sp.]|uniref:amidase n=1 Tax=Paraburkholderia sp. TaxID=1926495 RepID=UPI002B47C2CC|nr:amidase [Paraburkholderia sp.]HKR39891.1 amidase [Paraburkholderia sp.]